MQLACQASLSICITWESPAQGPAFHQPTWLPCFHYDACAILETPSKLGKVQGDGWQRKCFIGAPKGRGVPFSWALIAGVWRGSGEHRHRRQLQQHMNLEAHILRQHRLVRAVGHQWGSMAYLCTAVAGVVWDSNLTQWHVPDVHVAEHERSCSVTRDHQQQPVALPSALVMAHALSKADCRTSWLPVQRLGRIPREG